MGCKCIILNKLYLKHISFLTFFIISFMKIAIKNNIDQNKHLYQGLFNIYTNSISDLFALLPCLVKKLSDNIQYNKEYISKRSVIPKILLISFFDLASQICNFLFYFFKGRNELEFAKSN